MDISARKILPTILASSLGYFVDLYDLLLFSVVRTRSLVDLGVPEADTTAVGLNLLNWMLAGMMVGGIVWGIIGDKKGRLITLFGSILLYSVANILNGYITSVDQYRVLRVVTGFGLAGELGACITLVSELMKPEKRGLGTMFIAAVGMLGAAFAAFIGIKYNWRFAYKLGGFIGLCLLFFRFGIKESEIFKNALQKNVYRGNVLHFFSQPKLVSKYIKSILPGLPVYFVIGILITLAPEFGKAFGMNETPTAGMAVLICYISISLGDLIFTFISQEIKSRKKTIAASLFLMMFSILFYLYSKPITLMQYYVRCAILGFAAGYWVVLVTNISEQFGTNYRATVTTTAPNFLRGFLIPISIIFTILAPAFGIVHAAAILGCCVVIIPLILLYFTEDRFGKTMDWIEEEGNL